MADITEKIRRKSYAAKKRAAIKTLKAQTKEKIREIKLLYAEDPESLKAKISEKEHKRTLRMQEQDARLSYNLKQPRRYTLGENIFNSISHGIGAGLGIAALVLLVIKSLSYFTGPEKVLMVTGYSIFGSTLVFMYMMSTLYHALTPVTARTVFSRLDHAAVYLLIGGTATPLIFAYYGSKFLVPLCVVWGILAVFIALYGVFGLKLKYFAGLTFVLLGCVLTLFFYKMGAGSLVLNKTLFLGGSIAYIVGGFFAGFARYKGFHGVFHLFAIVGSVLHFLAIYGLHY